MKEFSERVLEWFDVHGRKHLPWQQDVTPYRVWISEIMLQQTQVATVIPYFDRFIRSFPDVRALADAAEDEVLYHWSGLGYYARARNMHRAARVVRDSHNGIFPQRFDEVVALPGIGRSTAGAILSLAGGQRHPILDGNVKRVLARHAGIAGWPGQAAVAQELWQHAEARLPAERVAAYNQAMMDLGATLCMRTRPACEICPVAADCVAHREHRQHQLPGRKPRKTLPERRVDMLVLTHRGRILLQKRPPAGIWGGLWTLPETDDSDGWLREHGAHDAQTERLKPFTHVFSHFRLHITPVYASLRQIPANVTDAETVWYDVASPQALGLAAPVSRILQQLTDEMTGRVRDGTHG